MSFLPPTVVIKQQQYGMASYLGKCREHDIFIHHRWDCSEMRAVVSLVWIALENGPWRTGCCRPSWFFWEVTNSKKFFFLVKRMISFHTKNLPNNTAEQATARLTPVPTQWSWQRNQMYGSIGMYLPATHSPQNWKVWSGLHTSVDDPSHGALRKNY